MWLHERRRCRRGSVVQAGIGMRTHAGIALTAGFTLLVMAAPIAATAQSSRHFVPSGRSGNSGGEHYDTVMGNYARRCTELDMQFVRESTGRPDSEDRKSTRLNSSHLG